MGHFFTPNSGEDKKKFFTKNGTLFSPSSGEDQKKTKGLHQKFLRFKVETCAHMHTRVKLLEGYIPRVSAPLLVPYGLYKNMRLC